MNRTDRLYAIVEELRAARGRPVSATRLASRFEVTTRTIERDLSALLESGAPIYAEPGRTGGYVLDTSATLPPVNFTAVEATAVAVALARAADSPLAADSRSALLKLMQAMPAEQALRAHALVERIRLIERPRPGQDGQPAPQAASPRSDGAVPGDAIPGDAIPGDAIPGDAIPGDGHPDSGRQQRGVQRQLAEAVTRHVVVSLDYIDRHGAPTSRVVEPVGLLCGPRGWYLLGWCRTRNDARAFRLDRVAGVRLTDEPAPERVIEDVFEEIPGMQIRPPRLV